MNELDEMLNQHWSNSACMATRLSLWNRWAIRLKRFRKQYSKWMRLWMLSTLKKPCGAITTAPIEKSKLITYWRFEL